MRSVLLSDEAEPGGAFFDGDEVFEAMKKAKARGVEIEVLVPGKSDVGLADWLREGLYPSLIKKWIRFYEYQYSILHAKSMVVDGRVAIIGSANFDFLSISMNWEQALVIFDVKIVREVNE